MKNVNVLNTICISKILFYDNKTEKKNCFENVFNTPKEIDKEPTQTNSQNQELIKLDNVYEVIENYISNLNEENFRVLIKN